VWLWHDRITESCVRCSSLVSAERNGFRTFMEFKFMLPCCIEIDFFLDNQPDSLIIPILFCYKTLHVSGIFSTHHQEFFTVHSALVSSCRFLMTASKQSQDGTAVPS
jgi:hypothetical protein